VIPSPEPLAALTRVAARLAILAEAAPDREVCGLVESGPDGEPRLRPLANQAPDPASAFALAAADVLAALRRAEGEGGTLLAIYHSHPRGGAGLSARDLDQALCDGRPLLPGVEQIVIALVDGRSERVRRYRWDGGRYRGVDLWRRGEADPARSPLDGRSPRHHR
jgi:proteasome lid subunit RPN8/RPN11